jgi:hypothetical protein
LLVEKIEAIATLSLLLEMLKLFIRVLLPYFQPQALLISA